MQAHLRSKKGSAKKKCKSIKKRESGGILLCSLVYRQVSKKDARKTKKKKQNTGEICPNPAFDCQIGNVVSPKRNYRRVKEQLLRLP